MFAVGAASTRTRSVVGSWNPLLIAAGVAMALMLGLRHEVGADWFNYEQIYLYVGEVKLDRALGMVDPGYALLNWVTYQANLQIWAVNLVCGAIFIWGLLKFANRQPNPWLCMLVAIPYLVIVVGMGYTRQAVALGFILAAIAEFERRSLLRFVLLIVVAATFHKTAIVILPLVAFATARNRFVVAAVSGALGFLLFTVFFERAMGIITASYIEQEYDAAGAVIRVMMNLVPAAIFLVYRKRFDLTLFENRLWRNYAIVALIMVPMVFLTVSSVIIDRLAIYVIPLQLFVLGRLPWAFLDRGRPNGQVALAVIAYSALVQAVWLFEASHAEYWLPYEVYPVGEA